MIEEVVWKNLLYWFDLYTDDVKDALIIFICQNFVWQVANLLNKMQLQTEVQSDSRIRVSAPPTRSDVLHACDVAEVRILLQRNS